MEHLEVKPANATVQVDKQYQFQVDGFDQYGASIEIGKREWKAAGGTITETGLFSAGPTAGAAEVSVKAGGRSAICQINIVEKIEKPDSAKAHSSGQKFLQWNGEIPPQKWNQFFMKVLVKLTQIQGLKLKVNLEAPVNTTDEHRIDEARSGLKDLGLEDKIDLS